MRLVVGTASVEDVDAFVAALGDVGDEHGCAVQAFDAAYVADSGHLESAVEHADRAFDRGENVASDRAVEVLLYAAGRRQIREALAMGVDEGEQGVVVVVDADRDATADEAAAAAAVADLLVDAAVLDGRELGDGERLTDGQRETDSERLAGDEELTDDEEQTDREELTSDGVYGDAATIREFFEVSDAELDAAAGDLPGIVRERVALLDVEK